MKKLFSVILSLNLILTPVAFAGENSGASVPQSNQSYDSTSQSKDGYKAYANQILVLGTSIVGSNIISQCNLGMKIPSIMTYMAGSLVHIASELMGAKQQNQSHKGRLADIDSLKEGMTVEGGEIQKAMLEQRKKEEEQNRDYIKSRITWMTAVMAIYTAATGLAIYEEMQGHSLGKTAGLTTCQGVAATLASPCHVGYAGCFARHFASCTASAPKGALAAEGAFASPTSMATGTAACSSTAQYAAGCFTYFETYMATAYAACQPSGVSIMGIGLGKIISAAYTMGFTMGGESGTLAKYGILLSSLLTLLVPSLEKTVMAAYNYPIPRSVTFGAHAVLAALVIKELGDRKSQAEGNLAKLQKLVDQFNSQTHDTNGAAQGSLANAEADKYNASNKKGDIKLLPNSQNRPVAKTCLAKNGNTFDHSEKACANPLQVGRAKFDINGVKSLNAVGNLAADMAQASAEGNMDKANALAGELSNMAMGVRATTDKLKQQYNDALTKAGKKPYDFDKGINDQLAQMNGAYNQASGTNASMASLDSVKDGAKLDEAKDANAGSNEMIASAKAPTIDLPTPNFDMSASNVGGAEIADLGAGANAQSKTINEELDQYESTASDIAKDPDVSIFKQVSNRYLLNYQKIFARKPEVTAAP